MLTLDIEGLVVIEVEWKCIISGKTSAIQKANLPEIKMEFEEILICYGYVKDYVVHVWLRKMLEK